MAQVLAYKTRQKDGQIERISDLCAMQGNPREAALMGYLAGIMDGEGTIGIKKYMPKGRNRTMCYYLYLYLGMQDKEVVSLFHDVFGGNIREERVPNQKSMWRWTAQGKIHVAAVLNVLMLNLRVKREQAILALHCCDSWALQERVGRKLLNTSEEELLKREEAYLLMRKLKHRKHPQRLNELTLETAKR